MGGPFLYEGEVPVTSPWEIGYRAARIERNMPKFLQNFDAIWEERKWELDLGLSYFEGYDFDGKSLVDLGQYMRDAATFQRRAWEIHFEIMYPLLAIYLQLYGVCASNGIDPGNIAKMLQGREHLISETDRAMWDLADEAKRLGISEIFTSNEAPAIRDALTKAGGNASVWLTKFDDFLQVYGHRTEGIADMNIPSWIEDNTSPLGQLGNFIASEERHDFDASLEAARKERDEAIESGQIVAERRGAGRLRRAARHQPGCELRLVERGPQLLHRPARLDPDAQRGAGDQQRGQLRHVRRHPVPVLQRAARRLRRAHQVGRPAVDGHRAPRLLRRLPVQAPGRAEGGRHAAGEDRGPGADRDLRHAHALLRGPQVRRLTPPSSRASRPRPAPTRARPG